MYTTIFHGMMSTTFLLLLQPFLTTALHIGTSSPCKEACAGGALTETKHLSCIDSAYGSGGTAAGQQMKTCLECTQKSNYSNASDTETDQYWMMCKTYYPPPNCHSYREASYADKAIQSHSSSQVHTTILPLRKRVESDHGLWDGMCSSERAHDRSMG